MSQPLQVKDVDTTGRHVVFYAAAFGNIDSYGDIIMPGAFKKTIAERGPAGTDQLKYLNQHDMWQLGGKITEALEDSHGLLLTAKVSATTLGNDMLILEADGVYEHSIGYTTIQSASETRNGEPVEILTELKLYEGSAVTLGANPNTPTVGIKSATPMQEVSRLIKSLDKFDKLLRKGSLSDETCQLLELQHTQLKQALSDLLAASLETAGAGEGVHSEHGETRKADTPDVPKAKEWLAKAIALHEKHMDGSVKPTAASQETMMKQMKSAMSALGGNMEAMKAIVEALENEHKQSALELLFNSIATN